MIDGPNERCAPEQFRQTKTPKSNETPIIQKQITTWGLRGAISA